MRRSCWWVGAGLLISLVAFAGCGDPFGPPGRITSDPTDVTPPKAVNIVLVSPTKPDDEMIAWGLEGQSEANQNHAIFTVMGPAPDDSGGNLSVVIKRAIADGASGLLLVPDDSPELGKTLAEAEAQGIAVVLLGRSIPTPSGSKPFTVVDFGPLDESARKIVDATIEDLKLVGRPVQGTALVLVDKMTDRTSAARVAALKAAASASGFTKVVEVAIDGKSEPESKKQAIEAIQANPDVAVILTDDPESMLAAGQARKELKPKPPFFVAGFVEFGPIRIQIPLTMISGYAQGRYEELAKLGVKALLSKLKGETVPEKIVLAPLFRRNNEKQRSDAASIAAPKHTLPPPTTAPPLDTPSASDANRKP